MYYTGIGIEDKRSVSILASVYRDLLKIGYPDTDTVFSDFGENSNCIEMIRKMRLFISDKTISYTGDRTVFAAAVTEWLKSLDKVL